MILQCCVRGTSYRGRHIDHEGGGHLGGRDWLLLSRDVMMMMMTMSLTTMMMWRMWRMICRMMMIVYSYSYSFSLFVPFESFHVFGQVNL